MEAGRKPAVCRALLVLLIVASSVAVPTAHAESCWKYDHNHDYFCELENCIGSCKDHGYADGRCTWLRYCQCLMEDCHH